MWGASKNKQSEAMSQNRTGVENIDYIKLRFLIAGCILTVLGAIFLILKGFSAGLVGILVVGIVLLVVGVVWKPRKKAESITKETD